MVILVGHVTPEDTAYWTKSGNFVFVAILSGIIHVIAPLIGSLSSVYKDICVISFFLIHGK